MSSVVAFAGPDADPIDESWLRRATELSRCGGPDGSHVRLLQRAGLGHACLRTGPHEASGPLTVDGQVWLSAAVRLDARSDLIWALRRRHRDLDDSTDGELLLRAYLAWGEAFLDHLAGDFAFALWDGPARRLVCARDQLGIVPLHYARAGQRVLVASAVDALLLHPAVRDDVDDDAIAGFLDVGVYADPAATAFKAIRQLPPAHVLTWSAGSMRRQRYWHLAPVEPLARFHRPEEAVERFRGLLDAAVADRLTMDIATTQLTGGMDSTSVAASAALVLRSRGTSSSGALRAITAVLGASSGDREDVYASMVAAELGIPIDVIDASVAQHLDPFAPFSLQTAEPSDYRFTDLTLQYARLPTRHAPVVLSGHGGDALLRFAPAYWVEWLTSGRLRRCAQAFGDRVRMGEGRPRPHVRRIVADARAARVRRREVTTAPWLRSHGSPRPTPSWYARLGPFAAHALDARALAADPLWSALFRSGDPSFTRIPVRFRYPLVDLRIVRFVRSLAPEPWLIDKRVLRDSAAARLPDVVRQRPKTPLVARASIVPAESRAELVELVRRAPHLDRFLDPAALAAAVAEEGASSPLGPREQRQLIWALGLAHWLWHREQGRSSTPCQPLASR